MAETDEKPLISEEKDIYYAGGPFDRNDPRSLINLLPREAKEAIPDVPVAYLYMSERELAAEVRPSVRVRQIRIAFWKEYDAAQASLSRMTIAGMQQFLDGLPSIHVRQALTSPITLSFIICPPASYDNMLEESLARGLSRIQEIMDLPLHNNDGEVDHKTVELILKATAFIDMRKNGMPTQRTEQTIKQLNVNVSRKDMKQLGQHSRIEDIDQKIKQLESQLNKDVIVDVES
jgi:hypothetical protein